MIRRGLGRRCAVCGSGWLFTRWFRMQATCPGCGLRFVREAGHWTGDLGLNTVVSLGTLLVVLLTTSALTFPNTNINVLAVASLSVALGVPVAFYPISKTLWLAIDLCVNPLRADECHVDQVDDTHRVDRAAREVE